MAKSLCRSGGEFVCREISSAMLTCLLLYVSSRGGGGGGDARMSDGTQANYGSNSGYDATYGAGGTYRNDTTV